MSRNDVNSNAPVMMISAANGFIKQSEKYSRDNAGKSLKKYTLLKKGELAYNHGASKLRQYGCCFELLETEARIPYVYHTFKINESHYTPYIAILLNNPLIDKQLKRMVSSSVRMDGLLNIPYDEYTSIILNLPTLLEQQKIATFLLLLDERITKQRELIEKLKTYKRGLIRDFLSNNCSYELRTLESLFEIKAGGDISKENCQTNQSPHFPYPVYANSLTNKGLYGYANYYKICGDTITVTGRGEIGHATARHENYVPIVRLLSLIPKTELDVDFFAEIINETNIFVESTGVPQLTSPQLGKVQVPWIEPSVQKNCAQIIKTIDNLVTKQQEIYNNLLLYKNGLLQQMFI